MEYEITNLQSAMAELNKLLEAQPSSSKARDFYETMFGVMCSMEHTFLKCEIYTRQYGELLFRVKNLEKLLALHLEGK